MISNEEAEQQDKKRRENEARMPAMPCTEVYPDGRVCVEYFGFTKREQAAISLRVPDSGLPWLDEMIKEAQRSAKI